MVPDGVSIQISKNFGKIFFRKSCITKIAVTIINFNYFPDFGLYLLKGFDFHFDLF